MENGQPQDWTERYRPTDLSGIEGNEDKVSRIRVWLKGWSSGRIPKKRGLLLSGPPGVGKTTIAHAIAKENGWNIVELNASEQRNAAAIRASATSGSQHISLDQFSTRGVSPGKTVILLDEVDHLSGGFARVSEERISRTLGDSEEGALLKGDSGGKAELLSLLSRTMQPVIMTCNDPMRLWGGGRSWRANRDRVLGLSENVIFDRVGREGLRRVAHRVLDSEGIGIDPGSLEALVNENPGDLRALVKDLQSLTISSEGHIDLEMVDDLSGSVQRDSQVNVFNALRKIYCEKSGSKASEIMINSDKDPDEMLAWFSWNNQSVLSQERLSRVSSAMSKADSYLATKFWNRAFRSWYWGSSIPSQAAVAYSGNKGSNEIFISFPDFLRRGGESWRTGGLIDRLSDSLASSKSSVREDIWPILLAAHDSQLGGSESDFSIAKKIGLIVDDHLALHGVPKSSKRGKVIIDRFDVRDSHSEVESNEELVEDLVDDSPSKGPSQSRLDSFS